jgi:hypothetical protein
MDIIGIFINIIIHMCILFVFLSLFFFFYISKKEQEKLNQEVDILSEKIPSILSSIEKNDKNHIIQWDLIKKNTEKEKSINDIDIDKYIEKNNKNLKYLSIIIAITMLLLSFSVYFYNRNNSNLNIFYIIKENIIIFLFIGTIEFMFFKYVASKYSPIYPVDISLTISNRIKEKIENLT